MQRRTADGSELMGGVSQSRLPVLPVLWGRSIGGQAMRNTRGAEVCIVMIVLAAGCTGPQEPPPARTGPAWSVLSAEMTEQAIREQTRPGMEPHDRTMTASPTRQDQRDRIIVGATRQEVLGHLGSPIVSIGSPSRKGCEILFFCVDVSEPRDPMRQPDALEYRNIFWPVAFEGDGVAGCGWSFYDEYLAQCEEVDLADGEMLLTMLSRAHACEHSAGDSD